MSQLDEARAAVAGIASVAPKLDLLQRELASVLGDAQNPPPDGKADMTIEPDDFDSLRMLEQTLRYCLNALVGARRV